MSTDLESLLRASTLTHGRIQLYVCDSQWQACIAHFDGHMAWEAGQGHGDPVDALRAALIEDERLSRDVEARYRSAMMAKGIDEPRPMMSEVDADGMCVICEGGGCDACRPAAVDPLGDMFG